MNIAYKIANLGVLLILIGMTLQLEQLIGR